MRTTLIVLATCTLAVFSSPSGQGKNARQARSLPDGDNVSSIYTHSSTDSNADHRVPSNSQGNLQTQIGSAGERLSGVAREAGGGRRYTNLSAWARDPSNSRGSLQIQVGPAGERPGNDAKTSGFRLAPQTRRIARSYGAREDDEDDSAKKPPHPTLYSKKLSTSKTEGLNPTSVKNLERWTSRARMPSKSHSFGSTHSINTEEREELLRDFLATMPSKSHSFGSTSSINTEDREELLKEFLEGGDSLRSLDSSTSDQKPAAKEVCPICKENIDPKAGCSELPCKHKFCTPCIADHYYRTAYPSNPLCPICMVPFTKKDMINSNYVTI